MKIAVVLPRNMTFTESGATSIDLIVRDQVQNSTYNNTSIVVGPKNQNPFPRIDYKGVTGNSQRQLNHAYLNEIQQFNPNIIVVHQYPMTAHFLAKKLPSIPVVLYRHGLTKPRTNWLSQLRKLQQFKPVAKIILVSEFIKGEFLKDFPTLKSKCTVIGNAVDTNFWKPAETKENIISYVGRALIEKGIIELIQGFQSLNLDDWVLELAVTVSTKREIEFFQQIQQKIISENRINLRSNLTAIEVQDLLSRSKIATLPSIVREGFPRSVVEAMSCGCATVTSTSGGTPEAVSSSAILLDDVNPDSISDTLNLLTKDPSQIQIWSERARKHAEQYLGLNSHIKKYDSVLEACVNK